MSNENIVVYLDANLKSLALSGTSVAIANGAIALANASTYDVVSDGLGYPDGMFVLTGQFGAAPIEGSLLSLYAQAMSIDGSVNAQAPETTRPGIFIGSFVVNDVTGVQSIPLVAYDLPRKAQYYVHNNGTGQSLNAGWTLKVTPRTFKAAA